MKKHSSFIILFLLQFLFPFFAFSKGPAGGDSEEIREEDDSYYPAIIEIDDDSAITDLEDAGVIILRRRQDMLLCYVPRQEDEATRSSAPAPDKVKGVSDMQKGRKVIGSMDKAREWFDAGVLHTGLSFPAPYTGKGVVTGICDIGIDPLHIAFLDDDGNPRIKRLVQYIEGDGIRLDMDSKAEYENWVTDTRDNWHATHVAGIMAGSYGQYRGMAPDSEIVITTSRLSDVGLLCGAEDILEYAVQQGKRAVINMSMANYTGPHDGSSLFSRYLDLIGEEAVVILSSGNGGSSAFTLPYSFSAKEESVKLSLYSTDWVQFNPYGEVDVWSETDAPVSIRLLIMDSDNNAEIVASYPWQSLQDGMTFVISSNPDASFSEDGTTSIYDEVFAGFFKGRFSFCGETDRINGRHRMLMQYDAHTDIVSNKGKWARYIPVIEVKADPGTDVKIYADNQYTVFRQYPGNPKPGSLLSFSDLATGRNVISVGMYVNRRMLPVLSAEDFDTGLEAGTISPYSSYSTLSDGRVMPLTVGPGHNVISAMSRHFHNDHPDSETINAETNSGGESYHWATCSGTSMSSPYVAGAVACWLEALPDLSISEIMEAIEKSNRSDQPDPENPRHGQGWFDAVEGLKAAMKGHTGVNDSGNTESMCRLTYYSRGLTLWNPRREDLIIDLYSPSCEKVATLCSSEPATTFQLPDLATGFYIATVRSENISLKFLIVP